MLRVDTQNLSFAQRARLLVKYLMYPGTNWISRDKSKVVRMFLDGSSGPSNPDARLRLRERLFRVPLSLAQFAVRGDHDPRVGETPLRGNAYLPENLRGASSVSTGQPGVTRG